MRSCNNCGVHRCNIFNNKRNPVSICPKYTPFVYPKVWLRGLVSKITISNDTAPGTLNLFKKWAV